MRKDWIKTIVCFVSLYLAVSTGALAQISMSAKNTKGDRADLHIVVKPGDNLTSIVKRELGLLELLPDVVRANNLQTPDSLQPLDLIIIPWELLQARNYAKVVFVKGAVLLRRKGEAEAVSPRKGDRIYLGDVITTGVDGFVSLSFKGASQVNIQPDSDMVLQKLECFEIERACEITIKTSSSEMNMDVRNVGFSKPTEFRIETPYATAAVRGTRFDFTTQDGNVLGVTDGVVQIFSNNNSNLVPLGKGVLAGEGRSINVLFDLLDKPEYNDFQRISAEDYISWQPVPGAASYEVVIAANESLSDVIASSTVDSLAVSANASGGRYFVSTRALANNGLKGFESLISVDQVELDRSVQPPELEVELIDSTLTVKSSGPNATEIQIGNRLDLMNGIEKLIDYKTYDLSAGDNLVLEVDTSEDIYLISRAIVNRTTVSAYSNLYEFQQLPRE